jgi:hypothetical protein
MVVVPGCGGGAFLLGRRRVLRMLGFVAYIVLQDHLSDRWRWLFDPMAGYSVKGAYHFLTTVDAPPKSGLFDDV